MSADDYLQGILQREVVDTSAYSPVRGVQSRLQPAIQEWAGNLLLGVSPSGSFAKGTANHSGTDIAQQTPNTRASKSRGSAINVGCGFWSATVRRPWDSHCSTPDLLTLSYYRTASC